MKNYISFGWRATKRLPFRVLTLFLLAVASHGYLAAQEPLTLCQQYGGNPFKTIGSPTGITYTSSYSNPNFANASIFIQGTLVVNVNSSFTNCTIKMGTNAVITTSNGANLSIDGSRFFACDQMWQGIRINNPSIASVTASQFEDALECFSINSSNTMIFTGNTLNRNRVGIRVYVPFSPVSFSGNSFTCTSGLISPWAGATSRSGMEISNTSAFLAPPAGQLPNTFNHLQCGMLSERSFVWLEGARFTDMVAGPEVFSGQPSGSGIVVTGGELDINPFGSAYNLATACQFTDLPRAGVWSRGANLGVRNALFARNPTGIDYRDNTNAQRLDVYWCEFRQLGVVPASVGVALINGIFLEQSNGAANLDQDAIVQYCFFEAASPGSIGTTFGIHALGTTSTNSCLIRFNRFDNTSGRTVNFIYLQPSQSDHFTVDQNTLRYHQVTSAQQRFAISCLSGSGFQHSMSYNIILGDNNEKGDHTYRCAFHIVSTPNIEMCSDSTDWGFRGYHLSGACTPMIFRQNMVGHHDLGLTVAGEIGDQVRRLNSWSTDAGAYTTLAAQNVSANWGNSEFIVHSTDPAFMPPAALREPDPWFSFVDGSLDYCVGTLAEPRVESFDLEVANGTHAFDKPVQAWDAERQVYYKLLRFPELRQNPDMADFFARMQDASAGKFAQTEFAVWKAGLLPESAQVTLTGIRAAIATKTKSLASMQNQAVETPNADQKKALLEAISSLMAEEQAFEQRITAERKTAMQDIDVSLRSLPQYSSYEQARADYLRLVVAKWMGTAQTDVDRQVLYSLVQRNMSELGVTALDARGLLPGDDPMWVILAEPPYTYETEDVHQALNAQEAGQSGDILSVSPNPANDRVTLKFIRPVSGKLLLHDVLGHLVAGHTLVNSISQEQETTTLRSGVYFWLLKGDDGRIQQQKFVVAH